MVSKFIVIDHNKNTTPSIIRKISGKWVLDQTEVYKLKIHILKHVEDIEGKWVQKR